MSQVIFRDCDKGFFQILLSLLHFKQDQAFFQHKPAYRLTIVSIILCEKAYAITIAVNTLNERQFPDLLNSCFIKRCKCQLYTLEPAYLLAHILHIILHDQPAIGDDPNPINGTLNLREDMG